MIAAQLRLRRMFDSRRQCAAADKRSDLSRTTAEVAPRIRFSL